MFSCHCRLASIPLMYPASLVFDVPSSAFVGLACANLFVGVVTTISSFVLQLFDDEVSDVIVGSWSFISLDSFCFCFCLSVCLFQQLKFIGSILNQVYFIFPHYCLGRGLMDMAQQHFVAKKFDAFGLPIYRLLLLSVICCLILFFFTHSGIDYYRSIFEWNYLGRNLLCMTIQAVVFFTFNLLLHYQLFPKYLQRCAKAKVRRTQNTIRCVQLANQSNHSRSIAANRSARQRSRRWRRRSRAGQSWGRSPF